MNKVRDLIEGLQKAQERKQLLYSRLLDLGGENPLQEEMLYVRLEEIEQNEDLTLDMMFESTSLSIREGVVLDRHSEGKTLDEVGLFFNLSGERIRQILEGSYKKLATEYKDVLQEVS